MWLREEIDKDTAWLMVKVTSWLVFKVFIMRILALQEEAVPESGKPDQDTLSSSAEV